jgi:hypothetical protein
MDLLHSFINSYLSTAEQCEQVEKNIKVYSSADKIFVIGLGGRGGVITEDRKQKIITQLNKKDKPVCFITLFDNKDMFQEYSDKISWDTYVWLATDPEHTIHFDNKLKARYSN